MVILRFVFHYPDRTAGQPVRQSASGRQGGGKGADRVVDALLYFYESKDERRKIIVQVKGGGVKRGAVATKPKLIHCAAESAATLRHEWMVLGLTFFGAVLRTCLRMWGRHLVCRFGRHLAARKTRQGCLANRQAGSLPHIFRHALTGHLPEIRLLSSRAHHEQMFHPSLAGRNLCLSRGKAEDRDCTPRRII
jgi:hypothetical protein